MTRAVSSMGSPRAIWLLLAVVVVTVPPNWDIAASKDRWVRVEDFSNTHTRWRPASVVTSSLRLRLALRAWARSKRVRYSACVRSARVRKSRFTVPPPAMH